VTYVFVAALMAGVGLLACFIPARRATKFVTDVRVLLPDSGSTWIFISGAEEERLLARISKDPESYRTYDPKDISRQRHNNVESVL